jgi:hypothetical protein
MCRALGVAPRKRKRIGSAYAAWRVRTTAVSPGSQPGGYGFESRTRYAVHGPIGQWLGHLPFKQEKTGRNRLGLLRGDWS